MVKTTHSAEETMSFASQIAEQLQGGEILALHGDLGGGKTTFTKGLAEALKVEESITSPTFVMLKVYPAKVKDKKIQLVHIDAYRTETIEDIKSVGIEDYLDCGDVVIVIEWAEKIKEILPDNIIDINFKYIEKNNREITINDFNN